MARGGRTGTVEAAARVGSAVIGPELLDGCVRRLLDHTVAGEGEQAAPYLDVIVEYGDAADLYGLCCAAGEVGRNALRGVLPGVRLDPVCDKHRRFAARFLAAYTARDTPRTIALFKAVWQAGTEARMESVCALLAYVGALARRAYACPAPTPSGGTR